MGPPWWEGLSERSPWATRPSCLRLPSKRRLEHPPQEQLRQLRPLPQLEQRLRLKHQLPRLKQHHQLKHRHLLPKPLPLPSPLLLPRPQIPLKPLLLLKQLYQGQFPQRQLRQRQLQPRQPNLQLGKVQGRLAGVSVTLVYLDCLKTLSWPWTTMLDFVAMYYCGRTICGPGGLRNLECVSRLAGMVFVCVIHLYIHMVLHLCPRGLLPRFAQAGPDSACRRTVGGSLLS